MKKEQVIEILKRHESETGSVYTYDDAYAVDESNYDKVATEIISLHETGQTDVVIDPEKEQLKDCKHERQSIEKIDHVENTMKCVDCGKILHTPEQEMLNSYNQEPSQTCAHCHEPLKHINGHGHKCPVLKKNNKKRSNLPTWSNEVY